METSSRRSILPLAVLGIGLAATLSAWWGAGRLVEREARGEFASQAVLATNILERRIQRYVDLLYGLEALTSHDEELNRREFSHYVAALDLGRRFPGVRAVELIRRVPEARREEFVARVRADRSLKAGGYPDFDIRPPGPRDEYWVIEFLEPASGNQGVLGLDIRPREVPAAAAARARDTGEPSATGRYRLAQETGTSYGLVIYLPIYLLERPATLEKRRDSFHGFVNVVLRIDDVLAGILTEPIVSGLGMLIHDVGPVGSNVPAGDDSVFYRREALDVGAAPFEWMQWRRAADTSLSVAGRQWRLQFEDVPRVSPWLQRYPLLILVAGLLVTSLLYGILLALSRTRAEAVALATRATRDLRTQLSFTQQLIEAMPNPLWFKDAKGRYLGCNRAWEDFIGVPRESLVGKTVYDMVPRGSAERHFAADQEVLDSGGHQVMEAQVLYAKDGSSHDVLLNKAAYFDPGGEVAGLVCVLLDITQRKQLEANTRDSNERLRAVIVAAPVAIIARDFKGIISMWNPAAERIFGWKEAEVLNTDTSIVPDHLREETTRLRLRAEAGETLVIEETQRQHRDRRLIDVSMTIAPLYGGADGKVSGTMVTITDISRRKQAEQALRESEEHLLLAMSAAQMGMWYWEAQTDRFTYSDGLLALFGVPADSPPADYRVLQERLHPEDRDLFNATLRHSIKHGTDFQVDYRVRWPDGSEHWIANRANVHRGEDGRARRVIGVAMNITERKNAEQRVTHMAHHDTLTGLPNRALLRDRIQQAIAQAHRNSTQMAVLFLDLDRFKTINDSLGHQLGDRLLQSVASRILVCVREGDTVSRVGGDEFVIVIPAIESSSDASTVASKILEVLASSFHLHGHDLHVGTSIGISLYPSDGSDAETLMRNADTAMYHAKDSGRGNFQFFTEHMNVAAQGRLAIENALRRALELREFELHYQPLYDLRNRSITGFEALLRWHPPGGTSLSPTEFVRIAEDSGLIVPIGEWVLREALRQAKAWQTPGRPLTMAINVSANQFSRSNFVERLERYIAETGIDPGLVELEVTESVIIEGAGEARAALDRVAALGVGIAIDDFGTGYSGLAYFKRLPIDTVKIDQSFIRDLTIDADDAAIVTAIIAMARTLGVDVVAEGVETEEQLEALKRLGCNRAQGYLFAVPMAASEIAKLLARVPAATAAAD